MKITICRKWNNPEIRINVSDEDISIEISLADFLYALADEAAEPIAESIAQAAPLAVQATLASAQQAVQHGADYAFAHLQEHLGPLLKTQDVQEGVMAMLQRRPAQFKGQ